MPMSSLDIENLATKPFEELNGYEKGVLARALLNDLIKQGYLERTPSETAPGEISFSILEWQMKLLAHFSDLVSTEDDDIEILLDRNSLVA